MSCVLSVCPVLSLCPVRVSFVPSCSSVLSFPFALCSVSKCLLFLCSTVFFIVGCEVRVAFLKLVFDCPRITDRHRSEHWCP